MGLVVRRLAGLVYRRMRTVYYPDTGGKLWRDSSATSARFTRTGTLWYDRDTNSIRSAIDGTVVTLGAVANASRIVSYLVIQTQRYDNRALLDMRVHEISVLVNVRATPPWMPETPPDEEPPALGGDDGTYNGHGTVSDKQGFDLDLVKALQQLVLIWWECVFYWPALHFVLTNPTEGLLSGCLLHFSVDLLGQVSIVYIFVISFVLSLFGITDGQWQIIWGVFMGGIDVLTGVAMRLAFEAALYAFLVVDASFNPTVLAIGISFAVIVLGLAVFLGVALFDQFHDYSLPVLLWLLLLSWVVMSFAHRNSAAFLQDHQEKASDMFRFAQYELGTARERMSGYPLERSQRYIWWRSVRSA